MANKSLGVEGEGLSFTKERKETTWKIIFTKYEGLLIKAIELINSEIGKLLIREEGKYTLHVLPLEQERKETSIAKNAFLIGCIQDSEQIRRYVSEEEIPSGGYVMKVIDNPENEEYSFVIFTAKEAKYIYYAVATFLDQYAISCAPDIGGLKFKRRLFDEKLKNRTISFAPKTKTRSVFSWGHVINDYRTYIANMARIGLNQLILWNDFKPINAQEIVEYAHEYGIEVIWGYAWGWRVGCHEIKSIDDAYLKELKKEVLSIYERDYANVGDGIYFQSFTELNSDTIGGRVVAEVVTDFVNDVVGELLSKYPNLRIQFGLHANSVHERLEPISHIDKRVEIIWENGGVFPFNAGTVRVEDEETYEKQFQKTLDFTKKILKLRGENAPTGITFKGFLKTDWSQFVYQSGPFILGKNSAEIQMHDQRLRKEAWRAFSADWLKQGEYARRFCEFIHKEAISDVNFSMAGLFDGGIYLPQAICSEIFMNSDRSYEEIVKAALDKDCVVLE